MKKRVCFILVALLILAFFYFNLAKAERDVSDSRKFISEEFNIPLDKIPTDEEELKQFYLQKSWERAIEKIKFFGQYISFFQAREHKLHLWFCSHINMGFLFLSFLF